MTASGIAFAPSHLFLNQHGFFSEHLSPRVRALRTGHYQAFPAASALTHSHREACSKPWALRFFATMPTAPEHHPVAPAPRVPDDLDEMRPPPASEATGDVPSERGSEDEDLSQQKDRPPRSPTPPNKAAEVLEACLAGDRGALAILATSNGGLLSDELRRRACECPLDAHLRLLLLNLLLRHLSSLSPLPPPSRTYAAHVRDMQGQFCSDRTGLTLTIQPHARMTRTVHGRRYHHIATRSRCAWT